VIPLKFHNKNTQNSVIQLKTAKLHFFKEKRINKKTCKLGFAGSINE
jgi:hypothetical protein